MKLRVASYNVHGFIGSDGKRDLLRVAEVVRALDAQVVALQEVVFPDDGSPLELPGFASWTVLASPVPRAHDRAFGNAVLTRYPVRERRTIVLDYSGREPRTALEVVLEVGTSALRVVATHLGLLPVERRFQVRTLLDHLAHERDVPTVLLGDFNEWFLFGRPLRWLEAHFGRGPSARTYPARFPMFPLDRIWVHPGSARRGFAVHRSELARSASDHLPVSADIEIV